MKRFYFVRHANTNKSPVDMDRTITDVGREQAKVAGQKLAHVHFDQVLASSALRTKQTAEAILGTGCWEIQQLDILYHLPDSEGESICNAMFRELGYASLREYYKHANADTLRRLGQTASQVLEGYQGTTMVVSHAVLINAIVHEMFDDVQVQNLALDTNMSECGIIEVVVDDNGTTTARVL